MKIIQINLILDEIQQHLIAQHELNLSGLRISGIYTLIIDLKKCSDICSTFGENEHNDDLKLKCMQTYKQVITRLINYELDDAQMIDILWSHIKYFLENLLNSCITPLFDDLKSEWERTIKGLSLSKADDVTNLCLAYKFLVTAKNDLENITYSSQRNIDLAEYYINQFENSRITQLYKLGLSNEIQVSIQSKDEFYAKILKGIEAVKKLLLELDEYH